MIEAEGPDGAIHEFPDGTDTAFMRKALAKYYGWDGATPNTTGGDKVKIAGQDKYQQEAVKRADAMQKNGLLDAGIGQRLFQGMTLDAGDELQSALQTPVEMYRHGTLDPTEGYKYAKAFQDERLNRSKKNTGLAGDAAELIGGVGTGVGLASKGVTLLKDGQKFIPRMLAMGGEGAGYGATVGFNSGEDEGRIKNAAIGLALGGGTGLLSPVAGYLAKGAASPIISNITARMDPEGFARAKLAEHLLNSGKTANDVATGVEQAAAEGQPVFAVADAMGNAGQRALSTVSRAPGPGREEAVRFLNSRQAGQARRVSNTLAEGLDANQTALQRETALTDQRRVDAGKNYGQARGDSGFIDVGPAISKADEIVRPKVAGLDAEPSTLRQGDFQNSIQKARSYLTNDSETLVDWDGAFNAKRDIDAMIDKATTTEQTHLIPIRDALDEQLAKSSKSYSAARDKYAEQSRSIEAIGEGKSAAMRGRHEDTIPAFNAKSAEPDAQQSFRVGYADPLIEQVNNQPVGVNKVRALTGDGPTAELQAFAAPGQGDKMARRLGREDTMFETRAQATGGSKTADNLADEAAAGIDPRIFWNLAHGNFTAAGSNLLHSAGNHLSGNTPEVRRLLGDMLLKRGAGPDTRALLDEIEKKALAKGAISDARSQALGRALLTGEADAYGQVNR